MEMYFLFTSGTNQTIETFYSKEAAEISYHKARPKKGTTLELCKGDLTENEAGVRKHGTFCSQKVASYQTPF